MITVFEDALTQTLRSHVLKDCYKRAAIIDVIVVTGNMIKAAKAVSAETRESRAVNPLNGCYQWYNYAS